MSQDERSKSQDLPSVSVFYSTVASSLETIEILLGFLNEEEQARARKFAFENDRHLFITAHALLHYSLCRMGQKSPRYFRKGQYGKPELVPVAEQAVAKFNLAHSGKLAACVISELFNVGIDVEVFSEFDFDNIVSSYFALSEQSLLATLSAADRTDKFFQLWTLKEAVTKAIGRGLSVPLADVAFALEPLLSLQNSFERVDNPRAWHIEQRRLLPLHWSALAVRCGVGARLSVQWRQISAMEIIELLHIERKP
jgi:4'-phosphopantetheinyl transferase